MRALISVSDKTGIVEFAKELTALGVEIISTGGTYNKLKEAGIKAIEVSELTGFPECLDGRVKTLHPIVHAGLLARRNDPSHMKQLEELKIDPIDMVVVNLYPFKATVLKEGVTREDAVENIDIGGPTMLRAAAKNYQDVSVLVDPEDYEKVLSELRDNKKVSVETNFYLMQKVFEHTSSYDTLIADYLKRERNDRDLPETLTMTYEKIQDMRYGENPHQKAAFYREIGIKKGSITDAIQLNGKELSFNNIND
ncbi:MAG: bifunctional phosphoribosylaminoimidazolecarboxamide formyltransferase/IMP cyclohydrolase, partial [Clostridiales bacterium]|nr:bifunctional phosphoribosylaminoimidazolecarboxamide formyltransferase/IMP cyclohydrolase [Clostridiales bacterium]